MTALYRMMAGLFWLLGAYAGLPGEALAQDSTPVLRIETGQHGALTNNAAAGGSVLVTASDDKTARIWSLPDLRPLGVLRPPIGPGSPGKLYAVAVSPDGKWAAVGGWISDDDQGSAILIFDLATRQIIKRLGDLPSSVHSLAVSPDGLRLAAGLDGANGVRVWDTATWRESWTDTDYKGRIYGLSFSKGGTLAAAAITGELRLSSRDGHRIANASVSAGKEPVSAAFSPDGRRLAIGFNNSPAVEVRDGRTLDQNATPDVSGLTADLSRVAWSEDGQDLLAAGGAWVNGSRPLFGWSQQGKGPRRSIFAGFSEGIFAIVPRAGQAIAVVSGRGNIRVLAADGTATAAQSVPGQDLNSAIDVTHPTRAFPLSPDGTQLAWATWGNPTRWVQFDAARLTLTQAQALPSGLVAWQDHDVALAMSDWDTSRTPKLNGRSLALDPYEASRSVAVTPSRALVGTSRSLRLFRPDASQIWRAPVPGEVWRVNQSRDGRLAVAALADGTIRWYRLSDGQEVLALFMTEDAQRWVAWTPKGYYAASPVGEDLIGWHVNRGPGQAADFFGAARFRDKFYRPDVVQRVLATLDETEALRQADAATGRDQRPTPSINTDLPPVITILSPADNSMISGGEVTIAYTVRSPSGRPIKSVRLLQAGRPAEGARGLDRPPSPSSATDEARGEVQIRVPPGEAIDLTLLADTTTRTSEPARLHLRGTPSVANPDPIMRPRLNVLAVGVSAYPRTAWRLEFAAKDARDFAALLGAQRELGLYKEVNVRVLTDAQATRGAVMHELDELRRKATANDITVVLLSGHGVPDEGSTFFLPVDGDPDDLYSTAVGQGELQSVLSRVHGRVVAFIDICHAGSAVYAQLHRGLPDIDGLVAQLREPGSGLIVFAAAMSRQLAVEMPDLGNGAFTSAVMEGLRGGADYKHRGAVRTDELGLFVAERVRQLTRGRQTPDMQRPPDVPDFPLVVVGR